MGRKFPQFQPKMEILESDLPLDKNEPEPSMTRIIMNVDDVAQRNAEASAQSHHPIVSVSTHDNATTATVSSPVATAAIDEPHKENNEYGQLAEPELYARQQYGIVLKHTRCQDKDGFVGTIHYVGPVASASNPLQLYAGIIWDDVTRGKHNGSVVHKTTKQLISHFACPHPTGASFVKLERVDLGCALSLPLLQQRYVQVDSPHWEAPNNVFGPHAVVQTNRPGKTKPIEFFGELKIRRQQQVGLSPKFNTISLRRQGISHVESTKTNDWKFKTKTTTNYRIKKEDSGADTVDDNDGDEHVEVSATHHVQKLDLAGNLLSNWNTVADVLKVFDTVSDLSLAYNRISDLTSSTWSSLLTTTMPNTLQYLNLRCCHITNAVETLTCLGKCFPQLQTVGLSDNPLHLGMMRKHKGDGRLSSDQSSSCSGQQKQLQQQEQQHKQQQALLAQCLPNLTRLDVSECQLIYPQDWILFSQLPRLTSLSLDDNALTQIPSRQHHQTYDHDGDSCSCNSSTNTVHHHESYFPALLHLQLSGTEILTWTALEGLKDMPRLSSLRFQSTPLSRLEGPATTRSHLIARLLRRPPQEQLDPDGDDRNKSDSKSDSNSENDHNNKNNSPPPPPFISMLTVLNSTPISDQERQDAERRYVGTVAKQVVQRFGGGSGSSRSSNTKASTTIEDENENMNDIREQFLAHEHPTFEWLAQKHAMSAQHGSGNAFGVTGTIQMLADTLLCLTFQSMAAQSCDQPPLHRRLPASFTVAKVKALLERQFGLDGDLQELVVGQPSSSSSSSSDDSSNRSLSLRYSSASSIPTTVLDDDRRELSYYGVLDGSTIYMHEMDQAQVLQRQEEGVGGAQNGPQALLLQRMQQQESELNDFLERQKRINAK